MSSLTPKEVAEMLQITTNTVYEMVKRGELNAYRVGRNMRIEPWELEKYKKRSSIGLVQESKKEPINIHQPIDYDNKLIICGNDILLDILVKQVENKNIGMPVFRSYLGSYNGLYALYQGEVSLATAHLWDGDTGEYNKSYVKRMVPGIPVVGIHLASRVQGIYVKKGNPLGIKGIIDLKRKDIRIVNREKGSGARILLDELIRIQNIFAGQIKGYEIESTSDIGTASMVARDQADIAIGKEMAAKQVVGVDFIPLQKENIEIIIKKEDLEKQEFKTVIDTIRSKEFKNEIKVIEGYDLKNIGEIFFET